MSGRVVVAVYKPRPGKEAELEALIRDHVPRLREVGLVTDRTPIAAKTTDGTIVEVFEWASEDAIAGAHANPVVTQMWKEFEACCWYETPANVPDLQRMFVSLDPID
jgi:quinol monooxygenase YgiN